MRNAFDALLEERGVTSAAVAKATGISAATLSEWRKGKYVPKAEKLQKVADYFGVPVDYLMTGNARDESGRTYYIDDQTAQLAQELMDNKELRILMDASRDLTPENVAALAALAKQLKGTNPNG